MDIICWIVSLFFFVVGVLKKLDTLSDFLTFLWNNKDALSGFITPILHLKENMQKMETAMKRLRRAAITKDKEATAGKILRGRVVKGSFQSLLDDACKIFDEVHQLNADFKSFQNTEWKDRLRALPSSLYTMDQMSKNALSLEKQMREKRQELGEEESGGGVDMFRSTPARRGGRRRKVMKEKVDQLWSWSEGIGMGKLVCVSGMGGVGKTELFEEFHEKFLKHDHHHTQVLKIEVSERMDLKTIQRDIARKLMLGWENEDQQVVSSRISDTLKENGKYVFLFDDVWKELPLSSIGIRCVDDGNIPKSCMVVFSTRIFALSNRADYSILLQCLPEGESWSLFLENIGKSSSELVETSLEIKSSAKEIVEECGGLPLALVNAGQAFSIVSAVADWKKGARDMKWEPWKVPRMTGYVFEVLRRSYDNLDNDCLKLCFTYFVLMPTHADVLWLSWLTFYWIGERVIERWTDIDDANAKRDQHIKELKEVGLVRDGDPPKLHNMIRAMAMWLGISRERYIAMPGMDLTNAQQGGEISWNNARRISLLHNDIRGGWPQEPNCPDLLTLLIRQNIRNSTIDSRFFQRMSTLRVLDLCALKHLPESIRQLRSLEFLQLLRAKITSLPAELGELANLRFLNLNGSKKLKVVPSGLFRRLKQLEYLGLYDTYIKWGLDSHRARVEELYDLQHLKVLGITFINTAALEALLLEPSGRLKSVTDSIALRDLKDKQLIKLPKELGEDMKKLKHLKLSHCVDLKEIVFGESNENGGSIENLSEMELFRLEELRIMFRGVRQLEATDNNDQTFSLRSLVSRIVNNNRLEMPPPDHEQCYLRKLKILKIRSCKKLEVLVMNGCEELFTFPRLEELWLEDLPAMTSICKAPLEFLSLRILRVLQCPNLTKLPFGEASGRMLSEIWGSKEWWNQLDWGDGGKNIKSRLDSRFRQVSREDS